jgi:hypothetical protein
MKFKAVVIGTGLLLVTGGMSAAEDPGPVLTRRHQDVLVQVSTAGPNESRSIGSFAVRVYRVLDEAFPYDHFIDGLIEKRDGSVVSIWVAKGRRDEEVEILIWTQSVGSGSYGTLHRYFFDGRTLRAVALPEPSPELMRGYMGHDVFDFQDGTIVRRFPRYNPGDANREPTGGTVQLGFHPHKQKWIRLNSGSEPGTP